MGLADKKKAQPHKEMGAKLFSGRTPLVARPEVASSKSAGARNGGVKTPKNFELTGQESGQVRSTDAFTGGQALGGVGQTTPIVDWDAMAEHARHAARPLSLADVFSRDGRHYLVSKSVLIALAMGLIGGLAVTAFAHYTDRIAYPDYSQKGRDLLQEKNARPAVEYFLSQSNRTELDSWSGSPYHIASLEALAESYDRDKCPASSEDTYRRVISLLRKAPFHDDVRLAAVLDHYASFLRSQKRDLDADAVRRESRFLQEHNTGVHWIWFFAVIAFAFEALYMTGVLLSGKGKLDNWPIFWSFALLGMLGITVGLFKIGISIVMALAGSLLVVYGLMPLALFAACALGKNMPAYHLLVPSHKRK